MAENPFKRSSRSGQRPAPTPRPDRQESTDPLDVEDLLVDGSKRVTVLPDGRLASKDEALRSRQDHIDLIKRREWGLDTQRVHAEQEAMQQKFPKFRLEQAAAPFVQHGWNILKAGQLYWLGKLRTHSGQIYTVVLAYPDNYPYAQIPCFVIDPYIAQTAHRYVDGHLCLYSNDHGGKGEGWNPSETTAVSYVAWTAAWLHAFEIWQKTGRWVGLAQFQA